jgi:hypothetical protein
MAEKSCKVSLVDSDGTEHSVRVTASTLFEAAATGIAAIRNSGWANVPFEPHRISVSVSEIPVQHEVKYEELMRWANRVGGRSPREIIERSKIRKILGIPDERRA